MRASTIASRPGSMITGSAEHAGELLDEQAGIGEQPGDRARSPRSRPQRRAGAAARRSRRRSTLPARAPPSRARRRRRARRSDVSAGATSLFAVATTTATSQRRFAQDAPTSPRGTSPPSSGRRPSTRTRSTSSFSTIRIRSASAWVEMKATERAAIPAAPPSRRARLSRLLRRLLRAGGSRSAGRRGHPTRQPVAGAAAGEDHLARRLASARAARRGASAGPPPRRCGASRIDRSGTSIAGNARLPDCIARALELLLDRRAVLVLGVEQAQQRARHEGRDEGHQDEGGE